MDASPFNPFLFHSKQLQMLFTKASKQKNPALWLYQNDARVAIFMLEALTRIHNNAFDEKLFGKWNKRFKKLEDAFGEIDRFLVFEQEFKKNKKVNNEIISRFSSNANKCLVKCNKRLLEKEWLTVKLSSFDKKIQEYTVVYNKEYLDELKVAIKEEIEGIVIFLEKRNFTLKRLEADLHDLRRRVRWLSIYAQALNGLVQLKKTPGKPKYKLNYFTKEVLNSPFNKLPAKPKNTAIIEFDANAFFALTWLINELGKLKDIGLEAEALSHAIFLYEDITEHQAKEKAAKLLGIKGTLEEDVLKKASNIISVFIKEDKILDKLIVK